MHADGTVTSVASGLYFPNGSVVTRRLEPQSLPPETRFFEQLDGAVPATEKMTFYKCADHARRAIS